MAKKERKKRKEPNFPDRQCISPRELPEGTLDLFHTNFRACPVYHNASTCCTPSLGCSHSEICFYAEPNFHSPVLVPLAKLHRTLPTHLPKGSKAYGTVTLPLTQAATHSPHLDRVSHVSAHRLVNARSSSGSLLTSVKIQDLTPYSHRPDQLSVWRDHHLPRSGY